MPLLLTSGVLLVGGALLALVLRTNRQRALAAIGSQLLATALALWAVAPVALGGAPLRGTWALSYPLGLVNGQIDSLSAFFLAWSLPMTLLGTIYAVGYLGAALKEDRNGGPHFALLNFISLSFLIVYSVQNALVFLLGWELAAVAAWLLVIWEYRNQRVRFAAFNYLVSTHLGLLALVAAFMYLHGQTNSMDFASFGEFLAEPSGGRNIVFVLLGVSFALKSAFFPVHSWLPRAHSAAPAHVSALMSGVIHKAGLFAFVRFTLLIGQPDEWMGWSVLSFGALSAVFGVLYTSSQRDLKRLLGYSSTENVGIAAMGFGIGYLGMAWHVPALVAIGFVGGLLHIVNHAFFKCLLFYAAGSVYRATHTVDIERLGGILRRLPYTGALFLVGAVAIAGLPPMNGFVSEFILYAGLFSNAGPTPSANAALVCFAAILGFVGAVSALSMVRAFGMTFLGTQRDPSIHVEDETTAAGTPWTMLLPMGVHAAGVVVIGVMPVEAVRHAAPLLVQLGVTGAALTALEALVAPIQLGCRALILALAVAGVVGWALGRNARRHVTWACGYIAANIRMQYTGSSFSEPLVRLFTQLLPERRRGRLSRRIFPSAHGRFEAHVVDAVERRLFEVLGRGEDFFVRSAAAVPEEPRFAFAAGAAVLVFLAVLLLSQEAP
jgi:hydrogenase-4 component B